MNNLLKNISFTKNETRVIIFVIAVLVVGFSIKYYKEILINRSDSPYDFSKSDSEFRERSNNADKNKLAFRDNDSSKTNEEDLAKKLEASDDSLNLKEETIVKNKKIIELQGKSININTAAKEELIALPGIGEVTADRIIIYRDEKKGFKKIEDLMNVKGIGKKKFEKIKEYIKTE